MLLAGTPDARGRLEKAAIELEEAIVDTIADAPEGAAPLETVAAAFEAAGAALQSRRDLGYVRARHALVDAHAELRERELIKLASLSAAVTKALQARGVFEPAASLAAEAGIAIFKVGFERWIGEKRPQGLAAHIRAAVDALKVIAADTSASPSRRAAKRSPSRSGRSK
jgi:hypothetical protein